jgi:hypothetical protein
MKERPYKYGMKIFGLCEAKMGHISYSEVHACAHPLIKNIMAHSVLQTESVNQKKIYGMHYTWTNGFPNPTPIDHMW